ncbi:MAG: acyl-CoA dehydrogenase family protein [Acidobacteriota bacterium]
MDFELNDDQKMIRDMVRAFAEEKIRPGVARRDAEGTFIADLLPGLAELGLLGMVVPESLGGSGLDTVAYAVAIEELARVCASTAVTVSVTNSVCQEPILRFGTPAQRERFLPPLAKGERLGGFCLTEPGAGTDAGGIRTRAVRDGDAYVLNGAKAWITNTHVGRTFVVVAVTDPSKGARGTSAFVVEAPAEGLVFLPEEKKMGLKASITSGVAFEDCRVPAENLLGEEGMGLKIALQTLDASRIGIAAQALGIGQGAFEEAVRYSKERQTFGKPLCEHQAIQFMLAESATALDAARLLTYRAAALKDASSPSLGLASSMAKLYASEAAKQVCDAAVQVHGAYGYSREYAVERFYRDVRVTTIYEGTSEAQRMVIAKALLR